MVLADASMWIASAMFVALFDITPVDGSPTFFDQSPTGVLDGELLWYVIHLLPLVLISHDVIPVFSHPKPFKSNIKPRSAKAEALLLSIDHEV